MTTPNQVVGNVFGSVEKDLAAFIGQGAYQVGNAAQNWGQQVTEEFVRVLTLGPGAIVADAFSSVEGFLAALEQFLLQLPLEALQMFRRYIPGALEAAFETIEGAVLAIMGFFNGNGAQVYLKDLQNWLTTVYTILQTEVHQILDAIQGIIVTPITSRVSGFLDWVVTLATISNITAALGAVGSDVAALENALQHIPNTNVLGILGLPDIGRALQGTLDAAYHGLTGLIGAAGVSLAQLAGAHAAVVSAADNAKTIGENNSTTLVNYAITTPLFMGIDPSADAVFPISNITASSPTYVNLTSATSLIGYVGTPNGGLKESVMWLGQNTTNITHIYMNLYSVNTSTGALTLLHQSADILPPSTGNAGVGTGLAWNYYNLPSPSNYITSAQGDWYAIEMVVTGTGTYQVVGIPTHWMPAHPTVHPKGMATSRDTSAGPTAPSTISTPTHSSNVPWFAMCGSPGQSQIGDVLAEFLASGTFTIPPVARVAGMKFDIIVLGGGGGGGGGSFANTGGGGGPGSWYAVTLEYGVDIPLGTTSFTITVGAGGGGGGVNGGGGGASSVAITGYTGIPISAAGGGGGGQGTGGSTGAGAGNEIFDGETYFGGGAQGAFAAGGISPGGGGGGGTGPGAGAQVGGPGAPGAVWVFQHQG